MSKKLTIGQMKEIARSRGGECLSTEYIDKKTKLKWKCSKGHEWMSTPDSIKNIRRWCPTCNGGIKFETIDDARKIAESKNGKCLSKIYKNSTTLMEWHCNKCGHKWENTFHKIKSGQWCPKCARKTTIDADTLIKIAESKNLKCLNISELKTNRMKLKWKCSNGHFFDASPISIMSNKYECSECISYKKRDIPYYQKIANERGGKLITKKYGDNKTIMKWKCHNNHIFYTSGFNVKRGGWCGECGQGRGESVARSYFEYIFEMSFPKIRPDWLRNKKNIPLELDGYSQSLKIAFEHQGLYHYDRNSFHNISKDGKNKFHIRQENDKIKTKICEEKGIALFIIPEIPLMLQYDKIVDHIYNEADRLNVALPKKKEEIKIDPKFIYARNYENYPIQQFLFNQPA